MSRGLPCKPGEPSTIEERGDGYEREQTEAFYGWVQTVRLIATSVQQVANDLGISKLTLSRWRSEHERGEG